MGLFHFSQRCDLILWDTSDYQRGEPNTSEEKAEEADEDVMDNLKDAAQEVESGDVAEDLQGPERGRFLSPRRYSHVRGDGLVPEGRAHL